jgi:hypothetical protein
LRSPWNSFHPLHFFCHSLFSMLSPSIHPSIICIFSSSKQLLTCYLSVTVYHHIVYIHLALTILDLFNLIDYITYAVDQSWKIHSWVRGTTEFVTVGYYKDWVLQITEILLYVLCSYITIMK